MDGGLKTATVCPKGRPVQIDKKINFCARIEMLSHEYVRLLSRVSERLKLNGLVMIFMTCMDTQ